MLPEGNLEVFPSFVTIRVTKLGIQEMLKTY